MSSVALTSFSSSATVAAEAWAAVTAAAAVIAGLIIVPEATIGY